MVTREGTAKHAVEMNSERFEAVFFVGGVRIMSYGNATRTMVMIEQERLQAKHNSPISLFVIPSNEAEIMGIEITCEYYMEKFKSKVESFRNRK